MRFPAVLFVAPDKVGGRADWDARFGEAAPLLDWPDIAVLAREGVSIESHSATHRPLSSLEAEAIYWEALWSAAAIERVVGRRPMAFSYPFGALDPVVERVVEECGYQLGFGTSPGACSLASDPLRISRLEIVETDDPLTVSRKIHEG
jgi:peptidoglycan/xylan/chitin deacetylase (PgdA/CDA1 family)